MIKIRKKHDWKEYINGNYIVRICAQDGTKIRITDADEFVAEFPESMDLKITNYCDRCCAFCHENSTPQGLHGDILNMKFIDTLRPWTEIAIGGGNPLSHPDLLEFLCKLKKFNIIPNITVHQDHFMKYRDLLKAWSDDKLVYGIGISLNYNYPVIDPTFLEELKRFPNAVLHVIEGVINLEQMESLLDKDLKVLILGYKMLRRGLDYYNDKTDPAGREFVGRVETGTHGLVNCNMKYMKKNMSRYIHDGSFKVISFDNLAIENLEMKELLEPKVWEEFYMGDDGNHTMYVDAVTGEFSTSSTTTTRFAITDDIIDMFNTVKEFKNCPE